MTNDEQELTILLVEDDEKACEEIRSYTEQLDDITLLGVTNDADEALELAQDFMPDAIILDLELHVGSGNGIYFLSQLHRLKLRNMPYILITTHNTSNVTLEAVRQLGADFIITKYQKDYTGQKPIEVLRMMRNAIQRHSSSDTDAPPSPAESERKLTLRIQHELDHVGISPKAIGYQYLTEAITMATHRPTPNLARLIASKHNKTSASVERAMQNAINRAWSNSDPEDLSRYYTAVINYERGVPTLTEFVCHYANKLRIEFNIKV